MQGGELGKKCAVYVLSEPQENFASGQREDGKFLLHAWQAQSATIFANAGDGKQDAEDWKMMHTNNRGKQHKREALGTAHLGVRVRNRACVRLCGSVEVLTRRSRAKIEVAVSASRVKHAR